MRDVLSFSVKEKRLNRTAACVKTTDRAVFASRQSETGKRSNLKRAKEGKQIKWRTNKSQMNRNGNKLIKLCAIGVLLILLFSACISDEKRMLNMFDLKDPTDYWAGTMEELATGGPKNSSASEISVIITFKKIKGDSLYPEIELKHFGLGNAKGIHYDNPPGNSFWINANRHGITKESFRWYAYIDLKEQGHEKIMEAIEHLQTLKFIKRAEPRFASIVIDDGPMKPKG